MRTLIEACRQHGVPGDRPAARHPAVLALADRSLAELPDPHEPLLRIWATGYVPAAVNASGVILAMPGLPRRAWRPTYPRPERLLIGSRVSTVRGSMEAEARVSELQAEIEALRGRRQVRGKDQTVLAIHARPGRPVPNAPGG